MVAGSGFIPPIPIIIGIDPGLTGAVAVIKDNGEMEIWDTPIGKSKSSKKDYIPALMAELFIRYKDSKVHVFIEKVHSMPHQGVASMFGFGKGYGIWLGILAALKLPYTLVTPQAWKKELMRGMGDKDAARTRACELFPGNADLFFFKKDIGRADSVLIAEFGRRTLK